MLCYKLKIKDLIKKIMALDLSRILFIFYRKKN
jgi:hypothetical protein